MLAACEIRWNIRGLTSQTRVKPPWPQPAAIRLVFGFCGTMEPGERPPQVVLTRERHLRG